MFKKLITILILLSISIIPISAYTINTTVTDYSIFYEFTPNLDKQAEVYFDNELLTFWVEDELIMCGLEPETCYRLTIQDLPDTVQHIHTLTLPTTEPPFFAEYGILGLFILIIALLIIAAKIEYVGYIAVLLSAIGFIYIQKTEPEFLTLLLFALLLFASVLISAIRTGKE